MPWKIPRGVTEAILDFYQKNGTNVASAFSEMTGEDSGKGDRLSSPWSQHSFNDTVNKINSQLLSGYLDK